MSRGVIQHQKRERKHCFIKKKVTLHQGKGSFTLNLKEENKQTKDDTQNQNIITTQSANWNHCYLYSGCCQYLTDLSIQCSYPAKHSHIFSLLAFSLERSLGNRSRQKNWLCPQNNLGLHKTNLLHQLDAVLDILLNYYPLNAKGFGKEMVEVHSWGLSLKSVSDASSRS